MPELLAMSTRLQAKLVKALKLRRSSCLYPSSCSRAWPLSKIASGSASASLMYDSATTGVLGASLGSTSFPIPPVWGAESQQPQLQSTALVR